MQRSSPPHQFATVRIPPEVRDQRSYQQLLCETHARVRRHLERAQLHQANPARSVFWRIELINKELSTMGITCQIGQKVTEDPIDEPRRRGRGALIRNLIECDFQLVDGIGARLIHTRMLAGGTDERAREQIRKRWVVVPVTDQAPQQIGPPQKRTIFGRRAADHDVVAASRAAVLPVQHEFLRPQAALPGKLVECRGVLRQLAP